MPENTKELYNIEYLLNQFKSAIHTVDHAMNANIPAVDLVLEYTLDELELRASQEICSWLPQGYIEALSHDDKIDTLSGMSHRLSAYVVCHCTTRLQLQASLALFNGKDTMITANFTCPITPLNVPDTRRG